MFNKQYFDRYRRKAWAEVFGMREKKAFMWAYWKRRLRKFVSEKDIILEVGCGLGECLRALNREFQTIGCDISFDAVEEIKRTTEAPLVVTDAEILPYKNAAFQAVIAFDVIEHLPNPESFFKEAERVLRKNGVIIFSTPNPNSFGARVKGRKRELKNLPYSQRSHEWYGWRDDSHINIRNKHEWRDALVKNGFSIIKDGSDTLWDIPYFAIIPYTIQKLFFISLHWCLTYFFGFFSWNWGENYICIGQRN